MDMKNRLIPCVLACLMIFLVGCTGNTAKEAAQEITKTETSFPAGNTETDSQEETAEEPEARQFRKKYRLRQKKANQPLKVRRLRQFRQNRLKIKRLKLLQLKSQRQSHQSRQPRRLKPKNIRSSQKNRQLPNKSRLKNRRRSRQNRNRQSRPKQTFDVSPYVSYAKEYAVSIGLSLDSTATECWDNPISANPNRSGIKSDIESRLNRYKNSEGFTAVWIWTEKLSDTEYNIYIGYC